MRVVVESESSDDAGVDSGVPQVAVAGNSSLGSGDEVIEENGILFWINRSGFPMDDRTWNRMWDHVAKHHPEGAAMTQRIQKQTNLPQIPIPQPPLSFPSSLPLPERIEKVQKYMQDLEYNHTGTQFYEIPKNRPVTRLMECAKEMIREALPIKCLEAVILGLFLTNGMAGIERYPISFKSIYDGNVYRHVVLGVYHCGQYGAIGMSRRQDLMYKPLIHKSLSDLIFDFEKCYRKYWHDLRKVKVGYPVSHDQHSYEMINWNGVTLNMKTLSSKEAVKLLEAHSRIMRAKSRSFAAQSPTTTKNVSIVDTAGHRDNQNKIREPSPVRIVRVKSLGASNGHGSPTRRLSTNSKEHSEYNVRI